MKEKVLFFDIDGTLVDNTYGVHEVPEGVKRELKRIQNDGHKLFICSGRPKAMFKIRIFAHFFTLFLILFNASVL